MNTLRFAGALALVQLSLVACTRREIDTVADVAAVGAVAAVATDAVVNPDPVVVDQPVVYVDHPEWGFDHPAVVEGVADRDHAVVIHRPAPVIVKKDERK